MVRGFSFLSNKRITTDKNICVKLNDFFIGINLNLLTTYQETLDNIFDVLLLDSYRGVIIPLEKNKQIDDIINTAVEKKQLKRIFLLVMLHQFLHISLPRRKLYNLYVPNWVTRVLYEYENTDEYDPQRRVVPSAQEIYDKIIFKFETKAVHHKGGVIVVQI